MIRRWIRWFGWRPRLRTKLREYYSDEGSSDQVRFELPKGRYNPNITFGREGDTNAGDRLVDQEIRFLKTGDDTTIAYSISGEGYPLVKAANWLSHLEYDHVSPVWAHWWRELGGMGQLVHLPIRQATATFVVADEPADTA